VMLLISILPGSSLRGDWLDQLHRRTMTTGTGLFEILINA